MIIWFMYFINMFFGKKELTVGQTETVIWAGLMEIAAVDMPLIHYLLG